MEEKNYTITIPGKLRVINIEASNLLVTTLVVTGGMKKKKQAIVEQMISKKH